MTPPEASTSKPSVKTPPEQPVAVKKLVKPEKESSSVPSDEPKPSTEPVRVPASSELASQLELLHERLDRLEKSVDRLRQRTPSVFGRFLADLAKVVVLAALLTIAWQTGWISQFLDWAAGLNTGASVGE